MPKIPRYEQRVGMSDGAGMATADSRPVVEPYSAKAKMWGQVSDAATSVALPMLRYQEQERRATQAVETLRLENGLKMEASQFLNSLKTRNDFDKFDTDSDAFLNSTYEKYSGMSNDPAVKRSLEKAFLQTRFQMQVGVMNRKAAAISEVGEAEHVTLRDMALKTWVGASPEDKPIVAREYELKVRELADRNVFSLGKAENFIRTFNSTAQELDFEKKLYDNPRQALIDATNPDMYQDVDAARRSHFADRARQAVKAFGKDIEQQQREQERIAKEQRKEAQRATGDTFVGRFVEGQLTRQDIMRSNLDPTGENSKEHWLKRLDEKPKAPEGYTTDKIVETKLYSRIVRDPEAVTDDEILNTIGQGLSHEDGKALINEKRTRLKEPKDPAEVAIYDNLKRDRKAGLFGTDTEGDLEYAKQVEAFKKWRKANPKEDPSTYYEKLTEPYKRGLIGTWLDWARSDEIDPKKRREEMAGATSDKKPAGTTGKSLVGYKNGKPVYDLGNGKWQVGE
jgi:hypothetical protein